MDGKSLNTKEDLISRLKEIAPQVFNEDKIDWEKLKSTFGDDINFGDERYVLNWAGKSDAFRAIQTQTTATLIPDKEESINFDDTDNIFIEGENLEVLKVLQRAYYGKIKMIYIDPPYNTGNDFIYNDKFAENRNEYLQRSGEKDEEGFLINENLYHKNTKESGHYHSNWLTMMYPRLFIARNLLRDDGVIFISIDDNEVHNLRMVMNEIFGEENFVVQIIWQKKTGASDAKTIANITEYILIYAKLYEKASKFFARNMDSYDIKRYKLSDEYIDERGKYYIDNLDRGGLQYSKSLNYPIMCPDGTVTYPNGRKEFIDEGWIWKWSKKKVEWAIENNFIEFRKSKSKESGWAVCYKNYLFVDNTDNKIERSAPLKNLINNVLNANSAADIKEIFESIVFPYSKPVELIKTIIKYSSFNINDIILDFFSGSCTTAHAVLDLNKEDGGDRKFIMVQLPEKTDIKSEAFKSGYKTIADIGKERIRRVIKKIEHEQKEKLNFGENKQDLGFKVFKLRESNFKIWRGDNFKTEEELEEQLLTFVNPVKEGSIEENMLYELLLKSGIYLNCKIERKNNYFQINDNELIIALLEINEEIVKNIIEAKPQKVITLDKLFEENDQLKTNTTLQMKDAGIEFKVV